MRGLNAFSLVLLNCLPVKATSLNLAPFLLCNSYWACSISALFLGLGSQSMFDWLVGWLVGWFVCCLVGLVVGSFFSWLVGWLVGWVVG